MIYNLKEYFKSFYPSYSYAVNGFHTTTPSDSICINENASVPANWIDRNDVTVQIFSRAGSPLTAKKQIQGIFEKVDKYFDVILPEANETLPDGSIENYPEIKAYQMIPIQRPTWFGYDQNGLALYVFNLKVTTK